MAQSPFVFPVGDIRNIINPQRAARWVYGYWLDAKNLMDARQKYDYNAPANSPVYAQMYRVFTGRDPTLGTDVAVQEVVRLLSRVDLSLFVDRALSFREREDLDQRAVAVVYGGVPLTRLPVAEPTLKIENADNITHQYTPGTPGVIMFKATPNHAGGAVANVSITPGFAVIGFPYCNSENVRVNGNRVPHFTQEENIAVTITARVDTFKIGVVVDENMPSTVLWPYVTEGLYVAQKFGVTAYSTVYGEPRQVARLRIRTLVASGLALSQALLAVGIEFMLLDLLGMLGRVSLL